MLNIPQLLATELSLSPHQVESALQLFDEGATVPFIARYRKERTGEMNEIQLRDLLDRSRYNAIVIRHNAIANVRYAKRLLANLSRLV